MKNKILIALAGLSALILTSASAQVDLFGQPRTATLASPAQLIIGVGGQLTFTNGPIDLHGFDGVAKIDFFAATNSAGTITATFETSPDTNTWTALTYALGVATSVTYTNFYLNTNTIVVTPYILPGTFTTPTSATAGWATPYIAAAPMTNVAAISCTANGMHMIGYNAADAARYLHVIWTCTGAATNGTTIVGATVTGRRGSEVK